MNRSTPRVAPLEWLLAGTLYYGTLMASAVQQRYRAQEIVALPNISDQHHDHASHRQTNEQRDANRCSR